MFFQKERRADAQVTSRHTLFDYLHSIETSSLCNRQIDVILYLVTLGQLIALELPLAGIIPAIVVPTIAIIVMVAVYGVVLLESLVGVVYRIRMPFLKDQFKLIRYVMSVPVSLYVVGEMDRGESVWVVVGCGVGVLAMFVAMVYINIYILPTDLSDIKSAIPLSVLLCVSQLFCVLLSALTFLTPIATLLKFFLTFPLCQAISTTLNQDLFQVRLYRLFTRLLLCLYFLSLWKQLGNVSPQVFTISMIISLLVFGFLEVIKFVKDRTTEYEHVGDDVGVGVAVFLRHVREVLGCLEVSKEIIKLKGRCSPTLINYLIQHNTYCTMANCRIRQNGGLDPLELIKKPEQIELFIDRISDQISEAVARFSEEYPGSFDVMACQLMLSRSLKQKLKSAEIARVAEQDMNTLRLQYYIYSMNKSIQTLQIDQQNSNQAFRFQQLVLQFKNSIMMMLKRMIQFWQFCDQQVVDVQRIIIISNRVNTCKLQIKTLWQNISSVQTYTTIHILNMYISFVKYMNQHEEAFELQKTQQILVSAMSLNKTFKYVAGEQYSVKEDGVVVVSVNQTHLGMIDCCNKHFAKILGYTQKELVGVSVNVFMPELYARVHDSILKGFLEQPQRIIGSCSQQPLFARHRSGHLCPIEIKLKKSTGLELKVMAVMNIRSLPLKEIYFMTDRYFNILDFSSKYQKLTPDKARNKELTQILVNLADVDLNAAFKKQISLTQIDFQLRGKQYLSNISISKLQLRELSHGYLFTFQLSKVTVYIKRLPSTHLQIQRKFSWSYRDEYFLGGHRLLNQTNSLQEDAYQIDKSKLASVRSYTNSANKDFGEGIRPLRYFNGEYVRLDDWGMEEDQDNQSQQVVDTTSRHVSQMDFQEVTVVGRFVKGNFCGFLYVMVVGLVGLITYHILVTIQTMQNNQVVVGINYSRYRVKNSISMFASKQLIDRFLHLPNNLYSSKQSTTKTIQSTISLSSISQSQYQQLQQLLYLSNQYNFSRLTTPTTLTFPILTLHPPSYYPLYALIGVSFFLIFVYYINLTTFGNNLLRVIHVFLKLEDAVIKYMRYECVKYFKEVESNGDKMNDEVELSAFEDGNMIERRRVKKIKNKRGNAFKDCLKIVCMLVTLVVYIGLIMLVQKISDDTLSTLFNFHLQTTNAVNLGSTTIISKLTNLIFLSPLIKPPFHIDSLNYLPRANPQWQLSSLQQYLYNDVCGHFPNTNCSVINDGVLTFGANTAYNSFLQKFVADEWRDQMEVVGMIELFYNYLWPVYDGIVVEVREKVMGVVGRTMLQNVGLVVPIFLIIFVEIVAMTVELNKKRDQTAILNHITNMIPYKFRTRHTSQTCGNYTSVLNTENVD